MHWKQLGQHMTEHQLEGCGGESKGSQDGNTSSPQFAASLQKEDGWSTVVRRTHGPVSRGSNSAKTQAEHGMFAVLSYRLL